MSRRVAVILGGLTTAQCFEIEENTALYPIGLAWVQQVIFRYGSRRQIVAIASTFHNVSAGMMTVFEVVDPELVQ